MKSRRGIPLRRCWQTARLAGQGQLSVGELLAFYVLLAQLYNPVVRLTQFHGTVAATRAAVDRIIEVLDEPETLRDRADALPVRQPRGALTFRDVPFSYRLDGVLVLERVSLEIEPGMKVGVLGASGAGKSTLLALALRLYEVAEGTGRCCWTASMSGGCAWRTCAGTWPWCRSRRSCSRARSAPT